jgi:thiol-disulfide isomerase/thioredoxin
MFMRNSSFTLRWTYFSVLVLLAGAGWIWASRVPDGATMPGGIPAPRQGFQAPDFTLETAAGEPVRLSELRGQPVLINLWASWCTPCRAEMPVLERAYQEYRGRGFTLLAVNATVQDSRQAALAFAQENGLTFPILLDADGRVSELYALRALPTSFFVNADGAIQEVVVGGPMSEVLLRVRIEELLKESNRSIP